MRHAFEINFKHQSNCEELFRATLLTINKFNITKDPVTAVSSSHSTYLHKNEVSNIQTLKKCAHMGVESMQYFLKRRSHPTRQLAYSKREKT